MVCRREVDHPLRDHDVAGLFECIPERGAELRGAGLAFLQGLRYHALQHQLRIINRRRELVAGMGICGRALAYGMQYAGCETGFKFDVVEANDDESPNQRYGYGLHGSNVQDKEVLLVDDVGSTGSSLLKLLDMVLDEGGIVHNGLVLTDRSGGKAREALAQRDVDLVAVYEMREFVEIKPALP